MRAACRWSRESWVTVLVWQDHLFSLDLRFLFKRAESGVLEVNCPAFECGQFWSPSVSNQGVNHVFRVV